MNDPRRAGDPIAAAGGWTDPETTATAASPTGAWDSLATSLGGLPRVLLRDTDAAGESPSEPPSRPGSTEMPAPGTMPGRLQLLGEIARGGMGAILKGRDPDLCRDLAVKVLLEKHRNDSEFLCRFVEEAQIAGQLQHPGVVPVYRMGTLPDDRPYFTMKLVKGRTLSALLAERREPAARGSGESTLARTQPHSPGDVGRGSAGTGSEPSGGLLKSPPLRTGIGPGSKLRWLRRACRFLSPPCEGEVRGGGGAHVANPRAPEQVASTPPPLPPPSQGGEKRATSLGEARKPLAWGFSSRHASGSPAECKTERLDPSYEDLPRFLSIFEQVCRTMAYAHSRRVIHRDLKPSNIMVGGFGEVQVMDWGLAKVLSGGEEAPRSDEPSPLDETRIATARSGSAGSDLSSAGSVIGTPAYMAPEQARGEIGRIDTRADVFALGAILCEILTGRPPYVGRAQGEVQRKAMRGDLSEALGAIASCGADSELIAIARDCLAAEPENRPGDAGVVADRVSGYLAGVDRAPAESGARASVRSRAGCRGSRSGCRRAAGAEADGRAGHGGALAPGHYRRWIRVAGAGARGAASRDGECRPCRSRASPRARSHGAGGAAGPARPVARGAGGGARG